MYYVLLFIYNPYRPIDIKEESPVTVEVACNMPDNQVVCTFRFTNNADKDYYILNRDSPLEGLLSNFLTVSRGKHEIKYEGIFIYRSPIAKHEFTLLKASGTIAKSLEISAVYKFPENSVYSIKYIGSLFYQQADAMNWDDIESNLERLSVRAKAKVRLDNVENLLQPIKQLYVVPKGDSELQYSPPCSYINRGGWPWQIQILNRVHSLLCAGYTKAIAATGNFNFVAKWFGRGNNQRPNAAFANCHNLVLSAPVTYDLVGNSQACGQGAVAWTFAGTNYRLVNLCAAFWQHPQEPCHNGNFMPTSKQHVLAHEWAHACGNVIDQKPNGYGYNTCLNFAARAPALALNNADNYAYFYCEAQYLPVIG